MVSEGIQHFLSRMHVTDEPTVATKGMPNFVVVLVIGDPCQFVGLLPDDFGHDYKPCKV